MKINEESFLIELNNGNEKALEYVIDVYGPLVNGIVRKVLGPLKNEGIVEECISDVFISLWNNIGKFSGDNKNFKNWIGGISKFKAIDYYRKYKNQYLNSEIIENNIACDRNLEEEVLQGIETKGVLKLVDNLKEPDRSIVIMRFLFGYTSKKIEGILGISVSTINTKISRCRKKLKEQYKEGC